MSTRLRLRYEVRYDDPDVREFKLNAERNNGRSGPGSR